MKGIQLLGRIHHEAYGTLFLVSDRDHPVNPLPFPGK
jgi:hypothetical protein